MRRILHLALAERSDATGIGDLRIVASCSDNTLWQFDPDYFANGWTELPPIPQGESAHLFPDGEPRETPAPKFP